MRNTMGSNLSSMFIGIGIGAMVALLFAPKSGEETREYLSQKAAEGKEYAQQKARELQVRATDMVEQGKQVVTDQMGSISSAIDAGRRAYWANKPNGSAKESPSVSVSRAGM